MFFNPFGIFYYLTELVEIYICQCIINSKSCPNHSLGMPDEPSFRGREESRMISFGSRIIRGSVSVFFCSMD